MTALQWTRRGTTSSLVALAPVFGLLAGGLFSYYGISKDGTDT